MLIIFISIWGISVFYNGFDYANINANSTLLAKNVQINGYACITSKCNISISTNDSDDTVNYLINSSDAKLLKKLNNYNDYLNINIYYVENGEERTIADYDLFLKTGENISNIKTETELRDKLGLYNEGTYTASLTLSEVGAIGTGVKDDITYSYIDYIFIDNKNTEYEMQYTLSDADNNSLNLIEGNKYNITFKVVKGAFDYKYYITDIN